MGIPNFVIDDHLKNWNGESYIGWETHLLSGKHLMHRVSVYLSVLDRNRNGFYIITCRGKEVRAISKSGLIPKNVLLLISWDQKWIYEQLGTNQTRNARNTASSSMTLW